MSEHSAPDQRGPNGVPSCRAGWDTVDEILHDWARERPDLDFTPVGIVTRISKVRTQLDAQVSALFAEHALTPADFQVIVTLRRSGAPFRMPQASLMDALALTSGTVSVRIDRLERSGIVSRSPDPTSARSTLVQLTAKGEALFDTLAPAHLANEDRLLSALTGPERQTLSDLLRRLLSSYETQHRDVAGQLGFQLESAPVARQRRRAVGLSDTPGLLVSAVHAGSAAERADVARGDLIVEIDDIPVVSTVGFVEILGSRAAGEPVDLTVLRGDVQLSRSVSTPV